jgi:nucleotide-binding universal stress UspA family protein
MAGDVILGYDGSAGSTSALRSAVAVAKAFDANLVVAFGYEVIPMGGEVADYARRVHAIGAEKVAEGAAAARALDPSIKVEPLAVAERPVEALLSLSESRQAICIVVGGAGERPIMGAILGSVPHKLLHRSRVPVLVVPSPEE